MVKIVPWRLDVVLLPVGSVWRGSPVPKERRLSCNRSLGGPLYTEDDGHDTEHRSLVALARYVIIHRRSSIRWRWQSSPHDCYFFMAMSIQSLIIAKRRTRTVCRIAPRCEMTGVLVGEGGEPLLKFQPSCVTHLQFQGLQTFVIKFKITRWHNWTLSVRNTTIQQALAFWECVHSLQMGLNKSKRLSVWKTLVGTTTRYHLCGFKK